MDDAVMIGDTIQLEHRSLASKVADLQAQLSPVFLTLTCGETARAVCVNVAHVAWFEQRRHDWNGSSGHRDAPHTRLSLINGDHIWVREEPRLILSMIQGATGR